MVLLGIFVLVTSTWISVTGVHWLSPRTFPYTVGVLLLACGLTPALKSWTLRGEGPTIAWPDVEGVRTITVTLIFVASYMP